MSIPSGCSFEVRAIIGMSMIRCISKQLWGITCSKHCWGFYTNKMISISNCYESVFWLQSHMLPCNFGGTLVFWNTVPGLDKVACYACAQIADAIIPCFVLPNFRSELSSGELGFVELAYGAWVTDACNPDVNTSAVIQRQYQTFDVIKSIAIECVRAQQGMRGSKYHSRRRSGLTEQ